MKAMTWIVLAASGWASCTILTTAGCRSIPRRPGLMDFCALATKRSRRSSSQ